MKAFAAVLRAAARRITRDPFLMFMFGYPWLLALVLRELLPWLNGPLADRITLSDYYPVAACLVALLVPNAMGVVLGFQLIEEKEEGSLVAVAVTPMSLDQCFAYRAAVCALVTTPVVSLMALVIAGFAGDQVEGFAVARGSGFLFTGPLASFFIPRPWDLLVGILPTYWPVKACFAAVEGPRGLFMVALPLILASAGAVFLYRRFRRRTMAG